MHRAGRRLAAWLLGLAGAYQTKVWRGDPSACRPRMCRRARTAPYASKKDAGQQRTKKLLCSSGGQGCRTFCFFCFFCRALCLSRARAPISSVGCCRPRARCGSWKCSRRSCGETRVNPTVSSQLGVLVALAFSFTTPSHSLSLSHVETHANMQTCKHIVRGTRVLPGAHPHPLFAGTPLVNGQLLGSVSRYGRAGRARKPGLAKGGMGKRVSRIINAGLTPRECLAGDSPLAPRAERISMLPQEGDVLHRRFGNASFPRRLWIFLMHLSTSPSMSSLCK